MTMSPKTSVMAARIGFETVTPIFLSPFSTTSLNPAFTSQLTSTAETFSSDRI